MNAAILQRLIWKEYRFLRSFWLATLLLAACAAIAWRGLATWYERPVQVEDFFVLVAMITSLFALGAGGTAFSTEHEVGTAELLRRLPLDARHLWCGKLALAFASVIALKAVLWSAVGILTLLVPVHGDQLRTIWWCSWVSELELFAWAALMSLFTRQPLMAITWAITVASIIIHMTLPYFLWPESRSDAQHVQGGLLTDYDFALPVRTVFALGLLALTAALSTKWLRSPQPLSVLPEWWRQRSLRRRTDQQSWLVGLAMAQLSAATTNGQLLRLIWLQWRQSRLLWASLAVPFVVTGVWKAATKIQSHEVHLLFAISTGLLWLGFGVSVFHGQQSHFRFRYFAEHGVSLKHVWWGHQLALVGPLAASVALTFVVEFVNDRNSFYSLTMVIKVFGGLTLAASIVFATGQLAGMLFRQGMVAAAMGIVGLLIHALWFALLNSIGLANTVSGERIFLFGFAPLPLAWFFVSRWHVANWILERRNRATRLRLGLCLVVPWMGMVAGLMVFRAFEVPNVGVEPPSREQLLTLSDEERPTAEMYQAVIQSLGVDITRLPEHEVLLTDLEHRLEQSPEILEQLLAVTRRPVGAFAGPPQQQNAAAFLILRVLHLAEERASERNDTNQSIAFHVGIRRVLLHWRQSTDFVGLKHATILENNQIGRLMHELRADQWTPDQQRELAGKIAESSDIKWNYGRRAWEREFREAFDVLNGGVWPTHFSVKARNDWEDSRWTLWIPGERTRARRLLNAWHAMHIQDLRNRWNPEVWEMIHRCQWNTQSAKLLIGEVETQARPIWWDTTLRGRWQAIQVWLQMRAAKAELARWPETGDGLAGLGMVKGPPGTSENWEGWIEYLPKGLIGERVTEPFTVRGLDHLPFEISGDEPCLVLFKTWRERTEQVERVRQAKDSQARSDSLRGLRVEPLEPVPSAVGKDPPGF